MFRVKTFFASLFLAFGLSTAACASTLTGLFNDTKVFEIYFDDVNANGKLDLSEFTGWRGFGIGAGVDSTYPDLLGLGSGPSMQSVAVAGGACAFPTELICYVSTDGKSSLYYSDFGPWVITSDLAAPVPLPAGLPLVLTGLAGFVGLRIRKKWKVQV